MKELWSEFVARLPEFVSPFGDTALSKSFGSTIFAPVPKRQDDVTDASATEYETEEQKPTLEPGLSQINSSQLGLRRKMKCRDPTRRMTLRHTLAILYLATMSIGAPVLLGDIHR